LILLSKLSRREALRTFGIGAVLAVRFPLAAAAPAEGSGDLAPNVYLSIDRSGAVSMVIPRTEMGQGIRTSFAIIMADELAASWPKINVRQADGDAKYGDEDTDGSRSLRLFFKPLRLAAATVRQMLETAAAQQWNASIVDCRAVDHEVIHVPTGRVFAFGQLVEGAAALPVPAPDKVRLRDPSSRRYIGHPMAGIDAAAMVHGRAQFGADIAMPGLKFASIEHCPVYGGKARSFDPAKAAAMRGVERVIEIPANPPPSGHLPLGGIAVIAADSWTAMEARRRLVIDWDMGPNATHDSETYRAELETAVHRAGRVVRQAGNFETGFSASAAKVSAEYYIPYQAHATIEPPTATAAFEDGKLLILAPTQDPQGARTAVAQYLGMGEADITVRPTFLGNGFGRKRMHDFVCEAAWLGKSVGGRIRLVWSREDDLRHGYYHPVSIHKLDGGVDKNGNPIAWRHRVVFPSPNTTFHADQIAPDAAQVGQGVTDMPYAIPNLRCEAAGAPAHLRLAPTRGGMSLSNAFATCSFIDELAVAAGKDPANFLFTSFAGPRKIDFKQLGVDYSNYGAPLDDYPVDVGRLQGVLQAAMDRGGWGDPLLPHQGRGIAVHRSYASYAAAVVVATVTPDGAVSVPRVDVVLDCGEVVNPDRVRALMEDSVMFGLGFALYGGITVKNGAVEQANFDTAKLARAAIMPEIHTYTVPSLAPPGGAGDPLVPVIAPALCNAIFAATGKRIRTLPIDTAVLKGDRPADAPVQKG
jgi:isoquinoline 1-oxidoreductase beta subunit